MDKDLVLDVTFDHGFTFLKLIDCLKNSENAMLEFTPTSIKYNELANIQQVNAKKAPYLNINNSFELYTSKLSKYYYGMQEPEYQLYFNVQELKDKIKDAKGKDKIRLYKTKNEDLIYFLTIKSDNSFISMSFLKPLNMPNQDLIIYPTSSREADNPNCTVHPKIFKENCSKIKPGSYKKITMNCYFTNMVVEAIGPDGSTGHIFPYGEKPASFPIIDVSKINIDFDHIFNQDLIVKPIKTNINPNNHLKISISTSGFKSLGKLSALSPNAIKFFFEDGYLKILTCVGDFGHIRTYIGNDTTV